MKRIEHWSIPFEKRLEGQLDTMLINHYFDTILVRILSEMPKYKCLNIIAKHNALIQYLTSISCPSGFDWVQLAKTKCSRLVKNFEKGFYFI